MTSLLIRNVQLDGKSVNILVRNGRFANLCAADDAVAELMQQTVHLSGSSGVPYKDTDDGDSFSFPDRAPFPIKSVRPGAHSRRARLPSGSIYLTRECAPTFFMIQSEISD